MSVVNSLLAHKLQVAVAALVVLGGGGAAAYVASGGDVPLLGGSAAMADTVPEDVDTVMYFDPGVVEDQTTKDVVNGLIDISKNQSGEYDGPESYDDLMANTSNESELDVEELNGMLVYGTYPEASDSASGVGGLPEDTYVGVLIDSEWDEATLVNETEDETEYERDEYEGYTVYVEQLDAAETPDWAAERDDPTWVGVLDDGRYVLGTEAAVKDAIDVDRGATDAFGGELREAYDETRDGENTYFKFAARFPSDRLSESGMGESPRFSAVRNVGLVTGSYYTTDDRIGMQLRMQTNSTSDADDLESMIDGSVSFAKQGTLTNESAALLDEIEVEQEDSTAVVTFEMSVDSILDTVEAVTETWGSLGTTTSVGDSPRDGAGFDDGSAFTALEPRRPA